MIACHFPVLPDNKGQLDRTTSWFIAILLLILAAGCREYEPPEKYRRPDWLAGKVYTQVLSQPELSTFAECIRLSGYDSILDVSGTWTVFAPNNAAFSDFFAAHTQYSKPEDIPADELERLVEFHIVQNPWSKQQLRSLDINGWIDTMDLTNNEPRGYKRESLLLEKNWKFGMGADPHGTLIIADTLDTDWYRLVATDSRKYVPIFYKEYFEIYNLGSQDYEFYFDRSFDNPSDIYYAGGKILGEEIFAENGFVYNIDRVISPMPNAYQILGSEDRGHSYKDFLNLVYQFPEFTYNDEETKDQPGADLGYEVDSLFDLKFPELAFDIENENTLPPTGETGLPANVTIRYHHGLMAPTDEAFAEFLRDYIETGDGTPWGSLNDAPHHIKRMIANSYFSPNPLYPSNFSKGIPNGELDLVRLNEADIVDREYASNCTFIGLSNAIVPRAFKAVTGPVYLQRGYSYSMYATERSGLLSALKRENEDYMFFVEPDLDCQVDSSLLYNSFNGSFYLYQVAVGADPLRINLGTNDLRILILNHIGTRNPTGQPRKEFIKNRAGNYLVVNNVTGEVRGTSATNFGYIGAATQPNYPVLLSTETDNGRTYSIENWFSFSTTDLYSTLSIRFPAFHNLIQKAGLVGSYRYTFISDNQLYTIFAPSDSTVAACQADTLSIPDLKQWCLTHFIQGELIFTDGYLPPGYHETLRKDETSTEFFTVFSSIYIEPGVDEIRIRDSSGSDYVKIQESARTNFMSAIVISTGTFNNSINNAVIHETKRAFRFDQMDSK